MLVDFFIKRPIFSTVCSFIILLAGLISVPSLPVEQYPNIAPPRVAVASIYTGASAQVVENSVTSPLEQQINGATGIKYISSTSGNDGQSNISVTFDLERDIDLAAVDVQTRVAAVQGRLPDEVKRTGVSINKVSTAFVLAIGLRSVDNRYDSQFLSNYADLYIKDALKRIKGVGNCEIFGERKYSMRVWLDPQRLAKQKLTAAEVVQAVAEQNQQIAAGQIGQPPVMTDQSFQISVRASGRLKTPQEFEQIILKTGTDGSIIRIKDVGRVELGAEDYQTIVRYKKQEAVGLGIFQRPGSNAIEVAEGVRREMEKLSKRFPPGMTYDFAFDTTLAVKESIKEVIVTLSQAILLVVVVIFLFLQNWRSTIIPAITIPVSLIGTFAVMKMLGFSINTLTLFGLTLATGLVVDDAIVVLENISRFIKEKKLPPLKAATEAMGEVTGAVIAISLVLGAVFIPVAFFPGTTGQLYKQFALTIAISVAISTFNALTLTPALSALWLKEEEKKENIVFHYVNSFLDWLKSIYASSLKVALRLKAITLLIFVGLLGATYFLFQVVPTSFVPNEDSGYFITIIQAPEGVSVNYTLNVLKQIEKELDKVPEIESSFGIVGFSFSGNSPSGGIVFSSLKPWHDRKQPGQDLDSIINRVRMPLMSITDATVIPFNPPPIEGLGNYGGFVFEIQDLRAADLKQLGDVTQQFCRQANMTPGLAGIFSTYKGNSPQLQVDVDRDRAKALSISLNDLFTTISVMLGSAYVNDFDLGARIYRVYVQGDQAFRANPNDINGFYVRSQKEEMVPLSNLIRISRTTSPQTISHYNLFRSTEVNGSAAPGFSSGQAMQAMEQLAKKVLPDGMSYEWTGISQEEREAGTKTFIIFSLGLLFVFLVLAAQYESFSDPFIILFSVPLAMLGALLAQHLRGLQNDVFCQIGLVMLIGLASKNAILIVEFANQLKEQGLKAEEAVEKAAEIRLRPILMTSLAFIMGILPLVFASGAGAAGRHSLGTAVCGGMILSSVLSLYIVPVIYVLMDQFTKKKIHQPEHR
ncbi:MAG: multidrug efflux RND transporter permease subunit [Candidatus Obscuribacterales bacterium]|nr:multidrug efflux RND transporter permease subunit [Candidatus Obscuribacterales bacterium]